MHAVVPSLNQMCERKEVVGTGRVADLRAVMNRPVRLTRAPAPVQSVLKHLWRLTSSFPSEDQRIAYVHIYAHPFGPAPDAPLALIAANESGFEGIACVDDVARAALLALQVYEHAGSADALRLARAWLGFVAYMQDPDGRVTNFIVDEAGTRNRTGPTSYTGGAWWTARALWALATAWLLTGEAPYLGRFRQAHLAPTGDLKVQSVQALALMEVYRRRPRTALRRRILALCDAIVASGPGYFRDRPGRAQVALWGYHQLLAVARAGRLFARPDYVAACASTVRTLVRPVIAEGFYHVYPGQQDQQCAYSMSPLATGLEELYRVTHRGAYRDLALRCAAWLDGANLCGRPLYDARSGRCGDGIAQGAASPNCGAESAIEAGFIEMARRRLLADDRTRRRAGASSHAS